MQNSFVTKKEKKTLQFFQSLGCSAHPFSSCFVKCHLFGHSTSFSGDHLYIVLFVAIILDVDECKDKVACQCPECKCKSVWGSYECSCSGGLLYMREHDMCIGEYPRTPVLLQFKLEPCDGWEQYFRPSSGRYTCN